MQLVIIIPIARIENNAILTSNNEEIIEGTDMMKSYSASVPTIGQEEKK